MSSSHSCVTAAMFGSCSRAFFSSQSIVTISPSAARRPKSGVLFHCTLLPVGVRGEIPPAACAGILSVAAELAGEAFAHEDAGLVQPDDLHCLAAVVVLLGDRIQDGDRGGVPEVGGVHVDDDVLRVQRIVEL